MTTDSGQDSTLVPITIQCQRRAHDGTHFCRDYQTVSVHRHYTCRDWDVILRTVMGSRHHGLSLSIPSPGADYGEESTRTRTQARYLTRSIRVCITLNRSVLLKHCIASYCLLHTATRSPLSRLLTSLSISHVCTVERLPIATRTCMGIGQAPSGLVSFLPSMHSPKLASTLSITYHSSFSCKELCVVS